MVLGNLSDSDKQQVASLQNSIVIGDFNSISSFANDASKMTNNIVEGVLKVANSTALDTVGGNVNNLIFSAKKIDASSLVNASNGNWLTRLIPWISTTKERVVAQFSSLGTQIEKYSAEIESSLKTTQDSIKQMEVMGQTAVQQYNLLDVTILAGKVKLDDMREAFHQRQAEFKALPQDQVDPLKIQELQKEEQFIDTFGKKISGLEQMQQVVYLQIPQLTMMIKNAMDISIEFKQITDLTIPLWKGQFAQALYQDHQKKAADLIEENKNFTRDLLIKNSENLKVTTLKLAEQGARGLVDIDTLKKCQNDLISTVEGVMAIHNKARTDRQAVSGEIQKMKLEFKDKMQNAA